MPSPRGSALRVTPCGPYLLGARVGAGGMAAVFAARQEGPGGVGRLVAVKVMRAALSDDERLKKLFLREATIATRLEHPNIVRVYDVGESGGDIYLAMEFVHGATLAALQTASRGPLPEPIALRIVADVARGLHAAHELCDVGGVPLRLVHQDISPQNVMVGYDGVTKLLDFGVARLGALDASRTDSIPGKPSYLAPEQLGGARIDRRADVFALGVVMHELLTGARLFHRDTVAASYAAVLHEPIRDVRDLCPGLGEGIAAVVARALDRTPDERFASADELRRAIVAALAQAGLELADETDLAEWARTTVPPKATPAELERQIVQNAPAAEVGGMDVSEMPTRPPGAQTSSLAMPQTFPAGPPYPRPFPPVSGEREESRGHRSPPLSPETGGKGPGDRGVTQGRFVTSRSASSPDTRPAWVAGATLAAAGIAFAVLRVPARAPEAPGAVAVPAASSLPLPRSAPLGLSATAPDPPSPAASLLGAEPSAPPARAPAAPHPGHLSASSPNPSSLPVAPPPPPPATPTPAAASQAHLSVRSTPWGHVRLDGVDIGDSPIVSLPVQPGNHTVSVVTRSGEQRRPVLVKPGEDAKLQFLF